MHLYPLKFSPIYKERIWGGDRLKTIFGRKDIPNKIEKCGESWEISAIEGDLSVVSNGTLEGNNIQELIEIYMDELVGNKTYEKFGLEFPLLFKFLDTSDKLSIQVHPDNEVANERHHAWGKSELWYVIDCKKDAELIIGFNRTVSQSEYLEHLNDGELTSILNWEKAKKDDVFYIPAGRLHAILDGFLVAEIQQTSDITYRIYDWDRVDASGNARELNTELAIDVLDYTAPKDLEYKTIYDVTKPETEIEKTPFFTINRIDLDKNSIEKDIYDLDSFVVYMCISGEASIEYDGSSVKMSKGETVLVPASLHDFTITSASQAQLLEVYIS